MYLTMEFSWDPNPACPQKTLYQIKKFDFMQLKHYPFIVDIRLIFLCGSLPRNFLGVTLCSLIPLSRTLLDNCSPSPLPLFGLGCCTRCGFIIQIQRSLNKHITSIDTMH
ncbi:hypothetical protein HPP92_012993 [Vanilla planifolia]|uniref:Uncharacterized protein n=1 Tax=Vanilla planifolia TaxID=51239 RepID=A0A835QXV6_VANPL|nr:hypothetical protein HPP92_012993 [Vanilla planifolia]